MMRLIRAASACALLLVSLVVFAVPAAAQNAVCPTAPNGDSSNRCASTAFVQNSLTNPALETLTLRGSVSGALTQSVQAVAGSAHIVWGTLSGTPAVAASAPLSIATATGNISCPTCVATGTVAGGDLSGTFPNPSVANLNFSTATLSGIIPVANGGTGRNAILIHGTLIGANTGAMNAVGPCPVNQYLSYQGGTGQDPVCINRINWFNVMDQAFGAKCDGTTNDTAAFTAAIAAAVAVNGTVYIPSSTSNCRATLSIPDNTHGLAIVGDSNGGNTAGVTVGGSTIFTPTNNTDVLTINSPTASGNISGVTVQNIKFYATGSGKACAIVNAIFVHFVDVVCEAAGTTSGSVGLTVDGSVATFDNTIVMGATQAMRISDGAGTLTSPGPVVFNGGQLLMNHSAGIGNALDIEGSALSVVLNGTLIESTGGTAATSTAAVTLNGGGTSTSTYGSFTCVECHTENIWNSTSTFAAFEVGRVNKFGTVHIIGGNYWGHGNGTLYSQYFMKLYNAYTVTVDGVLISKLGNTHGFDGGAIYIDSAYPTASSAIYNFRGISMTDVTGPMYADNRTGTPLASWGPRNASNWGALDGLYTVANLPTCNAGRKGQSSVATDLTSPAFNTAATGGGSQTLPVTCNGSVWGTY